MSKRIEKNKLKRAKADFGRILGFFVDLRKVAAAALFAILGVSSFSGLFGVPSASAISTGSSRVAVTLSDIITLRILDSSASSEISNLVLDVTPTPNGVFTKNSMVVEAATSNPTGYKLYMSSIGTNPVNTSPETESEGNSDSDSTGNSSSSAYTTDLVNVDNTISDSIPTLSTGVSVTEADFRIRNSLYKNKWGYSLTDLSITDTSAITYTDIPANTEQRLIDEKEEQTEHGQTPVTIGVNVSSSIASGTYKNKLEFTAIANPIPKDFTLSFDANTEGTVENLPEIMTASAVGSSYTFNIPETAPTRAGYVLKEYNTKADETGDAYQPGEDFTILADDVDAGSTSKTLYAIWQHQYNYSISFSCGSGSDCPNDYSETSAEMPLLYNIPEQTPTKRWWSFTGWSESEDEIKGSGSGQASDADETQRLYITGDTVTLTSENNELTLYAYYTKNETFTVNGLTFNSNIQGRASYPNSSTGNISSSAAVAMCKSLGGTYHIPTRAEFNKLFSTEEGLAAALEVWEYGSYIWFWSSTFNGYTDYGYGKKAYYYQFRATDGFNNAGAYSGAHNIVCVQ